MNFGTLVGQHEIKERLSKDYLGAPSHAYLFTGALGIGKTAFSLALSQALLCENPNKDGGCGKCKCCMCFEAGSNPDFRRLQIPSDKKTIKVDDVRKQVVSDVALSPQLSKRKVYMIDGDGLNEEGQNSLLKSLEEPPKNVCFVIECSDSSKLLPTVLSRTTEMKLLPLSIEETVEVLKLADTSKKESEETLSFLATFSAGIAGKAMDLLTDDSFSSERQAMIDMVLSLPDTSYTDVLCEKFNYFSENKDRIEELLLLMLWVLGDLCYLLNDTKDNQIPIRNQDKRKELKGFLEKHSYIKVTNIGKAADAINNLMKGLAVNVSFESACCNMLLNIKKELGNDKNS